MARKTKEIVTAELIAMGIEFDKKLKYNELYGLLKASTPLPVEPAVTVKTEPVKSPAKTYANEQKAKQIINETISKQNAALMGVGEAKSKELHPQQQLEKIIRGYVAKKGGFRDGVTDEQKEYATKLLEKDGRTKVAWDLNIGLPGYH